MKTVLETLQGGTGYLEGRGVEDARLSMEHMLAKVLGCKRLDLYMQFDRPMEEEELQPLRDLLKRRAQREPLQHLLGEVEFCGRVFKSDARALIPRPETEELVSILLKEYSAQQPARVVDIGCGSGVIGLSLAAEWKDAKVSLVDISSDALALAKDNAAALELSADFSEGDLLAAVDGEFDLVVANLPYIAPADMEGLQAEVQYDPALALDGGGAAGEDIIRRLIADLPTRLKPGGMVALELGEGQADSLAEALAAAGLREIRKIPDLSEVERFLFALR